MTLFERILAARGLVGARRDEFLFPDYKKGHDPYLLPDMHAAVDRLVEAHGRQEHITIYGDYDIDGLTATTVLVDAFEKFGFKNVTTFIPNRFVEGYGMTVDAVERIAESGATLIVTVDCGSLSEKEIVRAKELGVDVIVTDHHNVAPIQPPAVAVINPKRLLADNPTRYKDYLLMKPPQKKKLYPFLDLPGVGVAFKLVQAMQTRLDGLPYGQEKWLLDLVALGTVCDVVTLVDENRSHVYWGLKVLSQTRRPGLRALMSVASVEPQTVNARSLGFALGPRMNASGRLDTAKHAQDMLLEREGMKALELARLLDDMNVQRRAEQDEIFKQALAEAEKYSHDPVLVVSNSAWSHGIIGIVAAKLLERFKKPTYVLQEIGEESKGSARSYGDFSAADAIRAADDIIIKGGGHRLAAGVTMPTKNIDAFRKRVNEYYRSLDLKPQPPLLLPKEDVALQELSEITQALIEEIESMEPFGNGNPEPVLKIIGVTIATTRTMGAQQQHLKWTIKDTTGKALDVIAFNADPAWNSSFDVGDSVTVWIHPIKNEWRGQISVEGRMLHVEPA